MDPLKGKYTPWQRMIHKFQSRRDIPFRKKFFCGYDLHGNTYWEFTLDGNMQRLRRKMEPYKSLLFKSDYFSTVPPQWLQWLRRTRYPAPTLEELTADEMRQQKIKVLAAQAESKWYAEKERLEQEHRAKLQHELQRARDEQQAYLKEYEEQAKAEDPWKQADESKDKNPIESAKFTPRR
ncbi:hypothetical protein DICA3_B08966 [Diutina catenulata]